MKKTILGLFLLSGMLFVMPGHAATIIYKAADGKQRIISKVKLQAINGNLIALQIDKGIRYIARNALLKYYSEDISTTSGFEDGSSDYEVVLGPWNVPQCGITGSQKKKGTAVATFEYSISRKGEGNGNVRVPYFYLFVLTTGNADYGSRKMYIYSYPEKEAKLSSKNGYNEAKMLEKALSADRPYIHNRSGSASGISGAKLNREATFKLTGIENRKILAWHLVVWGKEDILQERDFQEIGESISKHWWLHYQNK